MWARVILIALVIFMLSCRSNTEKEAALSYKVLKSEQVCLLDKNVCRVISESIDTAELDNSEIVLSNSAINNARIIGVKFVPLAMSAMKNEKLDVNQMLKLFSACDQIFRDHGFARPPYYVGLLEFRGGRVDVLWSENFDERNAVVRQLLLDSLDYAYKKIPNQFFREPATALEPDDVKIW